MFSIKQSGAKVAVKSGVAVAEAAGDLAKKAEIALRISQARTEARAIAELSKKLAGASGRMVAEIAIVADQIIDEVEKDPRDFQVIRSFFDYNLGKAKEVVEARVSMSKLPDQEANVQKIDEVIGEIFASFRDFYTKCHANDVFSAQVASESLSRIMKAGI